MPILYEPIKEVLELKNYINGERVKSEEKDILNVTNPANQTILGRVPMSTPNEVQAWIKAAKEAFSKWRQTSPLS